MSRPARRPAVFSRLPVCLALLLCLAGCASGGAVRELGALERQAIRAGSERLEANEALMEAAALSLGELGAEYVEKEFEFDLALARAKRLESMRAPWVAPAGERAQTQRSVVLYHLYEVELAEQRVVEARMQERRVAAEEVLASYRRMIPLLEGAAENMEIVLRYLNQPKGARILSITEGLLREATSFREALRTSDSPRLRRLADDVARYEELAGRAREQADQALDAILRARREVP